jgi:polyisoprenoid-binding protein YceI
MPACCSIGPSIHQEIRMTTPRTTSPRTSTRLFLAVALLASLATGTRPAIADDFALDQAHASIIFGISHMGLSYTYGRFNKMAGEFSLDAADPAKSTFKLTIDATSIDTANAGRDKHLNSGDFLNTGEFPLITFESTKVATREVEGKTVYDVTGNFTMHGVTKEVTLPLVKLGEGDGPGGYRAGFACETTLLRSEYDMKGGLPAIGDEVTILISFEGVKQ